MTNQTNKTVVRSKEDENLDDTELKITVYIF